LFEVLRQRLRDLPPAPRRPIEERVAPTVAAPTTDEEKVDLSTDEAIAAPAEGEAVDEGEPGRSEEPEV
jgi:hypothetical protein